MRLKRGTRITYRYPTGRVVPGRIIAAYSSCMDGWYRAMLSDAGVEYTAEYSAGIHIDQITVVDNRASKAS